MSWGRRKTAAEEVVSLHLAVRDSHACGCRRGSVMPYAMLYVMPYAMLYVMLCAMLYVMPYAMLNVMLYAVLYVMLYVILCAMLFKGAISWNDPL